MKKRIQFIKMHGAELLTIFVGILVGILLLINPAKYAIAIIRIAGLLLIALAVFYGLFQVLIGFRKTQRMVDVLRMKQKSWGMKGISAGITLLFGFVIVLIPNMTLMSVWVFTGIAMILEGIFDAVELIRMERKAL